MSGYSLVKNAIHEYDENELILANNLYREKLSERISEVNYYKSLERLCKSGELVKIAKGTYHIPKSGKYGIVPPSEKEIISAFTANKTGTVVGYSLYNSLNLTTQISKTVCVLSSAIDSLTKTIRNIAVQQTSLVFSDATENMIHALEVLQNFNNIQDLNYASFVRYTKEIAQNYNESIFKEIYLCRKYKKSTIAFLQEILDYHNVENNLGIYLSALSEYKIPKMEELYETARVSE